MTFKELCLVNMTWETNELLLVTLMNENEFDPERFMTREEALFNYKDRKVVYFGIDWVKLEGRA